MNLPSFLWLSRIAAWSMGFALLTYFALAISGGSLFFLRSQGKTGPDFLRPLHLIIGALLVLLVFLLLSIGIVGKIGHFGSLGHSPHLLLGILVALLVSVSAISALNIQKYSWLRWVHIAINFLLLAGFIGVSWTGWIVVQKYLPENL